MLPSEMSAETHIKVPHDGLIYLVKREDLPSLLEESEYTLSDREVEDLWDTGIYTGGDWDYLINLLLEGGDAFSPFDDDVTKDWDTLRGGDAPVHLEVLVDRGVPKSIEEINAKNDDFQYSFMDHFIDARLAANRIGEDTKELLAEWRKDEVRLTPEEIESLRHHRDQYAKVAKETYEFTQELHNTVRQRSQPSKGLER